MSNTENEEVLLEESPEETPSLIPSIHYRGPENYVSIIGSSRNSYAFSRDTNYTVQPVTWEDFYEILLLDKYNIFGRLYVLSIDPIAATNLRRAAPEELFVAPELIDNQKEVDAVYAKKNELNALKNEYIGRINLQIARGDLEEIPEELELDAEKYADEQYIVRHTPVVETTVEATPEVPQEVDVVVDSTLPPMTDPAPELGTPVVSDVVSEPVAEVPAEIVPETPVETIPSVETPVVETPEVLENTSPSADAVTEPTDVVPTVEPVVENPTEETPTDTPTLPSETPSEEIVDPSVDDSIIQTTPTTRKKSSSK